MVFSVNAFPPGERCPAHHQAISVPCILFSSRAGGRKDTMPADPGYNPSVQALYFPDRAAAEAPDLPRTASIVPCRPDIRRVTSAFSGDRTSDVFPLRPPNRRASLI